MDVLILYIGINYDHYEFDGNRALYTGYDPVDNNDGINQRGRGHGNHVASLACGKNLLVPKNCLECCTIRQQNEYNLC